MGTISRTVNEWVRQKPDRTLSIFLFFFFLVGYAVLSPPYVTLEDSGSFLLTALHAGIAHPPGYPLYSLLGKLVSSLVFWGTPATKVHFLNCILGAGTCSLLFLFIRRWNYGIDSALLASLLFGSSFTVVYQSVVAEVYILNSFLFLLSWFYLNRFQESGNRSDLSVFGFAFGLSLACHWPLAVLSAVTFLPILWQEREKVFAYKYKLLFCFVLGLSPYLYFFIADYITDFLFLGPIKGLEEFLYVLLRKDRGESNVFPTATLRDSLEFLGGFLSFSAEDFFYIGFLVTVSGFVLSFVLLDKKRSGSLFLALVSNSVLLLIVWRAEWNDLTKDLYRFYTITPLLSLAVYFAIGWEFLGNYLPSKTIRGISTGILGLLLFGGFYLTSVKVRESADSFADSYAREVLDELPLQASLLVHSDMDAPEIAYVRFAEKFRSDLEVNSQLAALLPDKIFDRRIQNTDESRRIPLLNYISSRLDRGVRVFTTKKIAAFDDKAAPFPLYYSYNGLFYEVLNSPRPDEISERTFRFAIRELDREMPTFAKRKIWSYYRSQILGEYCRIVVEARMRHPALDSNPACMLMRAQSLNAYERNFAESDEYFLRILPSLRNLYVSEQAEILRQFLVNRVHWANSGLDKSKSASLMREGIEIAIPVASRLRKCDHPLLRNMEEIDRQLSLDLGKSLTETREKVCGK